MVEELVLEKKEVSTNNQIKEQDVANCIEKCALDANYWVDKNQVATTLELPVDDLQKLVENSETIVINKTGQLTTRKLYKEKTPFLNKLIHTLKNKID